LIDARVDAKCGGEDLPMFFMNLMFDKNIKLIIFTIFHLGADIDIVR
jgi:hypothetical protein